MHGDDPQGLQPPQSEDAQIRHEHQAEHQREPSAGLADDVVRRWRDLRGMLIAQLEMFESGGLTLHADDIDVSAAAIGDLKRSILEFDALILRDADARHK